jgi:hypothetical protein
VNQFFSRLAGCAWLFCFTGVVGIAEAAAPLHLVFNNNSGLAASNVYVGFVGGSTLNATNDATGAAMSLSQFDNPNWYTLSQLSAGVDLSNFSGRIYVCYGSPWTFQSAGYEPSPTNSSDPNYFDRYDKMELTYNGNAADVADTTSLDYFSIPMTLKVYKGGAAGTLKGTINSSSTTTTVAALKNLTSVAGAAVVTDSKGNFVRVLAPGIYPPTGGLPASPYNNLSNYLTYLHGTYAPAHGGVVATIEGHFGGVGPSPTTAVTQAQNYDFTATMDAARDIILTGSGTNIGAHTLTFKYADLTSPTGIYGANPNFYLDGATSSQTPQNDIYGWMIGDLLAGMNIGAVGSNVVDNGQLVGEMPSSDWFLLTNLFSGLQPDNPACYNQYAATMSNLSDAYNFAYSDRFAPVTATLNPAVVDTLQISIGGATVPEPASISLLAVGGMAMLSRRRRLPQI